MWVVLPMLLAGCGSDSPGSGEVEVGDGSDASAEADSAPDVSGDNAAPDDGGARDSAWDGAPDDGPPSEDGVSPEAALDASGDCIVITVDSFAINPDLSLVWSPVSPNLGASSIDAIVIELWEVGGFEQTTGAFDLSQGDDGQLLTCNHCVRAYEDFDPVYGMYERQYFQTSGTMTLTAVTSPVTLESVGSISALVLQEIVIDEGYSVPVPGGRCLRIESAQWDTRVEVGSPCTLSAECGDEWNKVCDPETATCVLAECGQLDPCTEPGMECLANLNEFAGICVPHCAPRATPACPSGQECIPVTWDDSDGYCMPSGPAQPGEPCEMNDISSGCVEGSRCLWDGMPSSCYKTCAFWSATPDCPSGLLCTHLGVCTEPGLETAQVGELCSGTELMPDCASDGVAERGVCVSDLLGPNQMCRAYCRPGAEDCPAGETCTPIGYGYETLGYCE
jgi:hypothetical protein